MVGFVEEVEIVRFFNIDFVNFILDSLEEALKWWSCCSKSDVDDVKS